MRFAAIERTVGVVVFLLFGWLVWFGVVFGGWVFGVFGLGCVSPKNPPPTPHKVVVGHFDSLMENDFKKEK